MNELLYPFADTGIPVVMLARDLRIRCFTPEAGKVLNLAPGDIGRALTDIRLNFDRPDLEERILHAIAAARADQIEVQAPDGRRRTLSIRPYRTFGDKIGGAILSLIDLDPLEQDAAGLVAANARLEAEIARHLVAQEELYRFKFICDNSNDTQGMIDRAGRIIYVNRRLCEGLGYTETELLQMTLSDIDPSTSKDKIEELFQRLDRGRVPPFESSRRRADGTTLPVEVSVTGVKLGGEPFMYIAARNITDRKRAARRLEVAVEAAPNAMLMVNKDGVILLVNAQTEKLFGYRREELVGMSIERLVPERFRSRHPEYRREFLLHPQTRPMGAGRDLYARRKDGSEVPVEIGLNPIEIDEGPCVLAAVVDITERKRAEEVSRRAHEELEARVQERTVALHGTLAELRRQMEQRRELGTRLARLQDEERRHLARELHDTTGQNLVALKLDLSVVRESVSRLDPRSAGLVTECLELAEQCIREIRTLSYLLHPPLLDERGLASALRLYSEGFAQRSGVEVNLDFPEDLGPLPPDVELAGFRVVQECLANVHRHSRSPTARVRLERNDHQILLEVSDAGRGFSLPGSEHSLDAEQRGIGIRGMRERVSQLTGSLEIDTGPSGTRVRAIFPLEPIDS